MAKFTTSKGLEVKVKITIPVIKAVRDELDINLGKIDTFLEVLDDVAKFVDVLYLASKKHLPKKMTPEQFGEALVGDDLTEAWECFQRAYLDFCPSHQRKTAKLLMARIKQLAEELNDGVCSKLATSLEESSE